ncbi:MAG: hypothetical protein PHH75_04825 [Candidatus Omnitrophica bacterium]|nr:hypothetical protein [Candidatus Omnitrophota bacterium]MDD5574485.1 hypothetical protein [Candidatus Omnitrophota bacterium]
MRRWLSGLVSSSAFSMAYYPSEQGAAACSVWNGQKLVVEPLMKFLTDVAAFIPDVLLAVCILITGWVVGRILQLIVAGFLRVIGFDAFARKTGMTELWGGSEKVVAHRWFGLLTFWVVMFSSFVLSLDQLRLRIASSELDRLFRFAFMTITILVIFALGMFLSIICSKLIRAFAQQIKAEKPDTYAALAKGIILVFTILACLLQIGVPEGIIFGAIGIAFATLCLSFILAFGLGGRVWAGRMLEKLLR